MSTAQMNRFPLPWCVEEQVGCFVVRDSNGQALSNVYFENESKGLLFTRGGAAYGEEHGKVAGAFERGLIATCSIGGIFYRQFCDAEHSALIRDI